MNRYIYTFTLAALSTVAGMLVFSPQVNAQTVNSGEVEMTANISTFCIFENKLDGTLGVATDDLTTLDSTETANNITALDGAAGSIDVTCNDATARVNISSVTQSNTASARLDTWRTTVSGLGTTDIVSTDGAAGTPIAVGSLNTETLKVNLTATYESNLAPGDYTFIVNLEATP